MLLPLKQHKVSIYYIATSIDLLILFLASSMLDGGIFLRLTLIMILGHVLGICFIFARRQKFKLTDTLYIKYGLLINLILYMGVKITQNIIQNKLPPNGIF